MVTFLDKSCRGKRGELSQNFVSGGGRRQQIEDGKVVAGVYNRGMASERVR